MTNILFLMKKFSSMHILFFLLITCFALPLYNHDRVTGPDPYNLSFVFYLIPYLYYIVFGAIWGHEQMEAKTRAYELLRILPLKTKEVVTAKFILILLLVSAYMIGIGIFIAAIAPDAEYLNTSLRFLIVNGSLCLVISGLIYLGLFRFGFIKFGKILFFIWILLLLSPVPINIVLFKELGLDRNQMIHWIAGQNWWLLLLLCLLLYFFILQTAIRLRTRIID